MRKSTVVSVVGSVLAIAALYACSSDSDAGGSGGGGNEAGSSETGRDTSPGTDGAQQADVVDAAVSDAFDASDGFDGFDGNTEQPIRCTQAEFDANDQTNTASATITFPATGAPAQYTPNCIKVSKNTVVTFSGNFTSHPLTHFGGTEPSTIPNKSGGGVSVAVATMDTVGSYGFRCGIHFSTMFGAIQVVP